MGKNSNYAYGEAAFWAGYLSQRLWIGSEKFMANFLCLSVENEHARKKKSKSNGIKSDPHRKRPEANSYATGFAVRWKSIFQYVFKSLWPVNVGSWASSPQTESEFSLWSIQSCCPLLPAPSCRKSPSELLRSNWVKDDSSSRSNLFRSFVFPIRSETVIIVFDPVGPKTCWRVISCNWTPGEAGNSSGWI